MPDATLKQIHEFFGYKNLSEFSADWKQVPDHDRKQIKEGIGNGSLTY